MTRNCSKRDVGKAGSEVSKRCSDVKTCLVKSLDDFQFKKRGMVSLLGVMGKQPRAEEASMVSCLGDGAAGP